MSSLKNYVKGLKDTTWTDARAAKLDTVPDVGTWTDTRAGYLDALAGGSLGYKPIATYGYSVNTSFYGANTIWYGGVGVSVSDYTACFSNINSHFVGQISSGSFYLSSNTLGYYISVKKQGSYDLGYNNVCGVSVTQFG